MAWHPARGKDDERRQRLMQQRPQLKKWLDRATKVVLWRRDPLCFICRDRAVDPAHFISRRFSRLRWDTHQAGNVHLLCRKCHDEHHAGSTAYADKLIEVCGQDALDELYRRRDDTRTMRITEMKDVETRLIREMMGQETRLNEV